MYLPEPADLQLLAKVTHAYYLPSQLYWGGDSVRYVTFPPPPSRDGLYNLLPLILGRLPLAD